MISVWRLNKLRLQSLGLSNPATFHPVDPPRFFGIRALALLGLFGAEINCLYYGYSHYVEIGLKRFHESFIESGVAIDLVRDAPEKYGRTPSSYWVAIRDRKEILRAELYEKRNMEPILKFCRRWYGAYDIRYEWIDQEKRRDD